MIKKTRRPSIAIDMDGVLADIESHFIAWYQRKYGVLVTRKELLGKPEPEAFPVPGAVLEFVHTPGFFRSIPVMEGAVEAVKVLMEDFDVFVVSAATEFPLSLAEKQAWLQEHFPFISWKNIIFCGDKHVIDTDYMIDDHCKNLDFCKGMPILFDAAHNAYIDHHQRVQSWSEVLALFKVQLELEKTNETAVC